jgi:hypothetical protein
MVLLVRLRTAGRDRVSWIDATIVASGFGLLSWTFLMAPTASSNDLTWLGRLVALAYPVWDVLFLALLVRLLAGLGARLPALRLLAGAAALWLGYDTVYALMLQYGTYDQGLLMDAPWLLGFVVFGATGLHPSMRELTEPVVEPNTRLSWRRLALLTGASLIAPLLLSQTLRGVTPEAQTFSAGVVCWDGQEISDELVARADRALYAAKAAGRDRVTVGAAPVVAGQVRQGS